MGVLLNKTIRDYIQTIYKIQQTIRDITIRETIRDLERLGGNETRILY